MELIYLDHNATTPTHPEVAEAMARCYAQGLANPASQHRPGQQARRVLEDAREKIAGILGVQLAPPRRDRLIFTSGGTEANNLAVLGIAQAGESRERGLAPSPPSASLAETAHGDGACPLSRDDRDRARRKKGDRHRGSNVSRTAEPTHATEPVPPFPPTSPGRIVISAGEHQSVIEPAEHLLEQGWRMDTLGLTPQGVVRVEQLPPLLAADTRLVSVLLGNHETGVLQPVEELAALCNRAGVPLHTDAVQVVGKMPVDFHRLGVAAMSVAAHKFGGPLGIGALLLRQDVPVAPLMFGGHHQSGLRPGTEPVALVVGMAAALEIWQREQAEFARRLTLLRDRFERALRAGLPEVVIHGAAASRLPQTSNVAFPGLDGEVLRMALDLAGVACSVGAACSSGSTELSPTLRAMDLPKELVASSLRFSLGATTTQSEIDEAVRRIIHVCRQLQGPYESARSAHG